MLILSEKRLRAVMREELELFMGKPEPNVNSFSIKGENGGEIIMPNPTKEMFDAGKIKSIADII